MIRAHVRRAQGQTTSLMSMSRLDRDRSPSRSTLCDRLCLTSRAGESLRFAQQQPVHARAYVAQVWFEVGLLTAFQFHRRRAGEPDFPKSVMDLAPINIALTQVDPKVGVFEALEVLEVDFVNPAAERTNPVLRVAVEDHVADVEPGFDPRALELVYISGHFERAQQESVPNFLDGDDDF